MTRPKPRAHDLPADPAAAHPAEYEAGVATANRLIDRTPCAVDAALALVTEHMERWPWSQGKPCHGASQWARSAGFAHTLREYRQAQGDA